MITEKMAKAVSAQINLEFESAYLYLALAAEAEALGFPGAGGWLRIQAQEELTHAMKFLTYMHDRNAKPEFPPVKCACSEVRTLLDLYQMVLAHEIMITTAIGKLADVAAAEHEYTLTPILNWFLTEQIQEESDAMKIVDKLKLAGNSGDALLFLDRELGLRPAPAAAPQSAAADQAATN
ncbi:MAG: ferritin [Victivallaceae bacterium]|nr:ferritin [Victivallaceae bacterium]